MSPFTAAMEAWVRAISASTMAGSGSIGASPLLCGVQAGASSGGGGMKSPRSRTVCTASPISGSDFPIIPTRPARLAGEARIRVTSTKSRPPASAMGLGVVICQKESPSGFMASVIIC